MVYLLVPFLAIFILVLTVINTSLINIYLLPKLNIKTELPISIGAIITIIIIIVIFKIFTKNFESEKFKKFRNKYF